TARMCSSSTVNKLFTGHGDDLGEHIASARRQHDVGHRREKRERLCNILGAPACADLTRIQLV
ncbi:hypothetical protein, partial [Microbacterium aurum]